MRCRFRQTSQTRVSVKDASKIVLLIMVIIKREEREERGLGREFTTFIISVDFETAHGSWNYGIDVFAVGPPLSLRRRRVIPS